MAGFAVASRAQAAGVVSVSVLRQAKGGLHQPLSLQARGESSVAAGSGAEALGIRSWPLAAPLPTAARANDAAQRGLLVERLQQRRLEKRRQSNVANVLGRVGSEPRQQHFDKSSEPLRLQRSAGNPAAGLLTPRRWISARTVATPGPSGNGHQQHRGGASLLPGAALLGLDCLLRAQLSSRRGLPLSVALGDCRWLHKPQQQFREILPRSVVQCQSQLDN